MSTKSPQIYYLPSGGAVSTIYTFESKGFQNAANTVFFMKSTIDSERPNKPYVFKSDFERMQYLIGRTAGCVMNSYS